MIENRTVAVAVCDACGHKDYANDQGEFVDSDGFDIVIHMHSTATRHKAYACRETHIGKAARAVLDRWRDEVNVPPSSEGGDLTPPLDAPLLPERNGDATAVTE